MEWEKSTGSEMPLAKLQQQRFDRMIAYARSRSLFYRRLYQHLPASGVALHNLPPTTKTQLMEAFDTWATDPAVTRASVDAFIRDKSLVGMRYLGKYSVWTTSGTTGVPGIFVHDAAAQRVYNSLVILRGYPSWISQRGLAQMLRGGFHSALILAVGDHYAGAANWEQVRRRIGMFADRLLMIPVLEPLPRMVERLNRFQPVLLISYPSVFAMLAAESAAGRLDIHPLVLTSLGEGLDGTARMQIETAFSDGQLVDIYAASEFPYIGFECSEHWLHANSDWVLLEPVDKDNQPVPAGEPSTNVLLTNLANRIQPILRYSLGDSITFKPEPCPCGNPLPAFRVAGRTDETMIFPSRTAGNVAVLPMAIASVVEQVPGVLRYQIIQTALDQLKVRLEVEPGTEREAVWDVVAVELQTFLASQGAATIGVALASEAPQANPVSGKFRHVYRERWDAEEDGEQHC
ncbi:MAG TPA: CoF synthetase [Anaerolineaceae bacterium]|nr:CoF synthetase [Anaerolineaceae bacterium]